MDSKDTGWLSCLQQLVYLEKTQNTGGWCMDSKDRDPPQGPTSLWYLEKTQKIVSGER